MNCYSWTCRLVRFAAGWKIDSGARPAGLLARHIDRCPSCQKWAGEQIALTHRIGDLAKLWPAPSPFDFAQFNRQKKASLAGVLFGRSATDSRADESERSNPWATWAIGLGATCAVAFATFCFWEATQTPNEPSSVPFAQLQDAIKEALEMAKQPTPLQKEFEAVLTDAGRAAKALGDGIASRELVAEWSERVYGPGE